MRHNVSGRKLGRSQAQRLQLFKHLVNELVLHGRVKTTITRAKAVRPLVERVITYGKKASIGGRREILKILSKESASRLIDSIVPQFANRTSGFLRIVHAGPRNGDNAEIVVLEWTEQMQVKSKQSLRSGELAKLKVQSEKQVKPTKEKKVVKKRKVAKKA